MDASKGVGHELVVGPFAGFMAGHQVSVHEFLHVVGDGWWRHLEGVGKLNGADIGALILR